MAADDVDEFGLPYRKNPPRVKKRGASRYYDDFYDPPQFRPGDQQHEERQLYLPRHPHFDDPVHRMRKSARPARAPPSATIPWRNMYPSAERRIAQMNAMKLRNVLKLPKAHKWVFYEWFYSNLDRPLLLGENDFRNFLRENYPNLKTRRLTRTQWSLIRRLMGKPRRCSIAFFDEERRALSEKREKIRTLQAKRSVELEFLRDLPDDMHVPMMLIIGTKVTARVRYPTDGLYTGVVDAIDAVRHCYRVTFDKPQLGTRSIPDYEVLSIQPHDTIPLSAYKTQHKASRNLFMSPARLLAQSALQSVRHHMQHNKLATSPAGSGSTGVSGMVGSRDGMGGHQHQHGMLDDCALCQSDSTLKLPAISSTDVAATMGSSALTTVPGQASAAGGRLLLNEADIYGGYPMKFLVMVTKLSKILEVKKRCVEELRDFNTEAERKIATQENIPLEFQHSYLTLIVHLERLNKELSQYLAHVLQYANEIAQEHGVPPLEQASDFKQRCDDDAFEMVTKLKNIQSQRLRNMKNMDLITKLTGILVQTRNLYENDATAFECSSVMESLRDLKSNLHSSNVQTFENCVEIHENQVMGGFCPLNGLNAFLYSHPSHAHYL